MTGVTYTGPTFADTALVTLDEVQSGEAPPPPGTIPHEVQPNENLSRIAEAGGITLEELLELNPQYADRNPDLIYPGEVVFVPPGSQAQADAARETDAAVQAVADAVAAAEGNTEGSDQRLYNQAIEHARGELNEVVAAELATGTSPDEILARHGGENAPPSLVTAVRQGATELAAAELASTPDSPSAQQNFDAAVLAEIEATKLLPDNASTEDHADAVIAAGESIAARLEAQGRTADAARVREVAGDRATAINNGAS